VPHRWSVLVAKDGALVHEWYAEGVRAETTCETESAGKTMIAAMIGTAVNSGKLDIDTPLHELGVQPVRKLPSFAPLFGLISSWAGIVGRSRRTGRLVASTTGRESQPAICSRRAPATAASHPASSSPTTRGITSSTSPARWRPRPVSRRSIGRHESLQCRWESRTSYVILLPPPAFPVNCEHKK
jgi:hypothetical protein